jgi:hypothetical protein
LDHTGEKIQTIQVDVMEHRNKGSGLEAICKTTAEPGDDETFIGCGDANAKKQTLKSQAVCRTLLLQEQRQKIMDFRLRESSATRR